MNPLTNVKNLQKLNQRELELGLTNKKSWHDQYKDSAWIFVGGLPYDLTEGDIICVFSQYGEIVNINLVRDKKSGKSKGYCFLCYEDQRSTVLAVDNFNGIKLLGRTLRVDHVEEYKKPKEHGDEDEVTMKLRTEGCAPQIPDSPEHKESDEEPVQVKVKPKKEKIKKEKKEKKSKKKKKKAATRSSSSETESDSESDTKEVKVKVKKEKHDPGYDKAFKASKRTKSPDTERNANSKYRKEDKSANDSDRSKFRESDDCREWKRGYKDNRGYGMSRDRNGDFDDRYGERSKDNSERDYNQKSRDRYERDYYQRAQNRNDLSYEMKSQGSFDRDSKYDTYNRKSDKEFYSREGRSESKYDRDFDRGGKEYDRNADRRSEKYRKDASDRNSERDRYRDSRR